MIRRRITPFYYFSTLPLSATPSNQQLHPSQIFKCNETIMRLAKLGRVRDARQVFDSIPQKDSVTWNSMISGYIQNGFLKEANSLFNAFEGKNVRSWTIMLTGYFKYGLINEARMVFESMPERNIVSWNALVSGYVQNGDLRKAREVFDDMPERNVTSWNSLMTGYCRCGMMKEARETFDRMEEGLKNSVSWMVIISGYVEVKEYREAWGVFLMMLRTGTRPSQALLVVGLSAVSGLNDLDLVLSLRTIAVKLGLEEDVVVGTAVLNAYTKNGGAYEAVKFFELMPEKNEYSWTTMIAALSHWGKLDDAVALYERYGENDVAVQTTMMSVYAQKGDVFEARRTFDEILNPNVIAWNAMISGYAQNGMLEEAKEMFFRMPVRNAVSWAAIISGFVQNGSNKGALDLFAELLRTGSVPNYWGFTSALLACANDGDIESGRQIHSLTIKAGAQNNSFVGNGLISMYAKCKKMEDVSQVFNTMRMRDTVSWNSVISGFLENCMLDDAEDIFKKMPKRDVVSWTSIISAYVQAGQGETALKIFLDMLIVGIKPNELTFTSLLSACANLAAVKLGQQCHAWIFKYGFSSCLCVCNSLITMYSKCGSIDGLHVFEDMPERDIVTWNAVLTGCAQNGLGKEAVEVFEEMEAAGVPPNEISFLGVLGACTHAGLVEKGRAYFNSMTQDHGINPSIYHYTCMVNLLGSAGLLSEAEALIENMPVEPDSVIWGALLAACKLHRDMEIEQRVAERLLKMGHKDMGLTS
ncbi:pentatricopeptide repeat-containing protein At4g02750-like [Herrania umbratica]|uniref:Pentatricopeptide repeat-containing protein At4g02750-like n=1 Tax=Herrania umbratica TaxID=108875 RepID=A0A6J1BFT7_9ROSI|nr:pentatricopeptide repeat-containing protein At4g02750-like [Herrania umbratica]